MARGSTTKTLVWILMGLLILGLGGFGVTNLGGSLRRVGSVGDKDIDLNLYARALQEEVRAIEAQTKQSLTFEQIQQLGIDRAVLGQVIASRALDHEAGQIGLSIGDENLRRQVLEIPSFQGVDGKFDRDGYKYALDRTGLSEAEFEVQLREETARALLQGAVANGAAIPTTYTDALIAYIAARRNFTWARLGQGDLAEPLPTPTPEQLQEYHQNNLADFTLPETKRITFAWLSPDAIVDQVQLDDTVLRAAYDERIDEYVQPERRLVERLAFADDTTAAAAKAQIDSGATTFEALVTERGLKLSDVDMGDMAQAALGAEGAAVFGATEGSVVGPFASGIGPALFRVNGILPAQEVPYEEALPDLRHEMAIGAARRQIEGEIDSIDDMLAGGATLEDLAKETDMKLGTVDYYDGVPDDIAGYSAFRDAAAALTKDDFPQVIQLDDGGIIAMRLNEVLAPRIQPVADVQEKVLAGWETLETRTRLRAQAEALVVKMAVVPDMAALGLTTKVETDITRGGFILGTPPDFIDRVFAMAVGNIAVFDSFGSVLIVKVDAALPADESDPDIAGMRLALDEQARGGLAQDLFAAYAADIQSRAGITLDQNALNAVHANFR